MQTIFGNRLINSSSTFWLDLIGRYPAKFADETECESSPVRPNHKARLVESGIYCFSRSPSIRVSPDADRHSAQCRLVGGSDHSSHDRSV